MADETDPVLVLLEQYKQSQIGRVCEFADNVEAAYRKRIEELKRQNDIARKFIFWVGMNAENELWRTIRDEAVACEFKMNHPEL